MRHGAGKAIDSKGSAGDHDNAPSKRRSTARRGRPADGASDNGWRSDAAAHRDRQQERGPTCGPGAGNGKQTCLQLL